jgi:hypothetical protein
LFKSFFSDFILAIFAPFYCSHKILSFSINLLFDFGIFDFCSVVFFIPAEALLGWALCIYCSLIDYAEKFDFSKILDIFLDGFLLCFFIIEEHSLKSKESVY